MNDIAIKIITPAQILIIIQEEVDSSDMLSLNCVPGSETALLL